MRSIHSNGAAAAAKPAFAPSPTQRTVPPARPTVTAPAAPAVKRSGYGMPCAKCRKYYSAALSSCPVCKSTERVSATTTKIQPAPAVTQSGGTERDEERERILREFKAKLYATHTQINTTTHACVHARSNEDHESPSVCKACHSKVQARVDLLEAVLHMDLREAAQIIYDAVWADPSDCNKTYQNAAQALLSELRKRAGLKTVLGRMQPLTH